MTSLAQILKIIVIERHVRVVDIGRSDWCLVMDDIPERLVAPLAQPPVNSFEFQPCGRTPQVDYLLC